MRFSLTVSQGTLLLRYIPLYLLIPLYKGKGTKSECSNYRGITEG